MSTLHQEHHPPRQMPLGARPFLRTFPYSQINPLLPVLGALVRPMILGIQTRPFLWKYTVARAMPHHQILTYLQTHCDVTRMFSMGQATSSLYVWYAMGVDEVSLDQLSSTLWYVDSPSERYDQ
jgi:hypothetical protein